MRTSKSGLYYTLRRRPHEKRRDPSAPRGTYGWYWAVVEVRVVTGRVLSEITVWRGESEEEGMDHIVELRRKAARPHA